KEQAIPRLAAQKRIPRRVTAAAHAKATTTTGENGITNVSDRASDMHLTSFRRNPDTYNILTVPRVLMPRIDKQCFWCGVPWFTPVLFRTEIYEVEELSSPHVVLI